MNSATFVFKGTVHKNLVVDNWANQPRVATVSGEVWWYAAAFLFWVWIEQKGDSYMLHLLSETSNIYIWNTRMSLSRAYTSAKAPQTPHSNLEENMFKLAGSRFGFGFPTNLTRL